eukprot:7144277-Heterocapsa_arctica.AAC.1
MMHTPAVSLKVVDLMERAHRMVGQCSFFPRAQAAFTYVFDPISSTEIIRHKKLLQAYQARLSDDPVVDVAEMVWVICDTRDLYFGKT